MTEVEIGIGKSGRRSYGLDEVSIVPSRRTRDIDDVDITFQLDAFKFGLPVLAAPMDAIVGPSSAVEISRLGGLGVLNLEGLWTRYEDPEPLFSELSQMDPRRATSRLQEIYKRPIDQDLLESRVKEIGASNAVTCAAVTPKGAVTLHSAIVGSELDVLLIQGTVVSAEHVTKGDQPVELERFIRDLDIPVIVGGCSSYQAARHLMRTGAVAVTVGVGSGRASVTRQTLGIGTPQATAIADVAGARSRHLEETGFYVEVIADGGMSTGGDVAKALALGADAVMIGSPLARASGSPGKGTYWSSAASHRSLPRGSLRSVEPAGSFEEILVGPAHGDPGLDLFGALKMAMALCGYASIREFHKAEVVVASPGAPFRRG